MLYYYNYTRNINDLEALQLFVKQNGFTDLLGFNYNSSNYQIQAVFNYELSVSEQNTLENLILNVYTNPVKEETDKNKISSVNSTFIPLSGNGVFNGLFEDVSYYTCISVMISSNTLSLTNGIELHFSMDGITTDFIRTYTQKLNQVFSETVTVPSKYFKLVYKNGPFTQTSFRVQTIYHVNKSKSIYDTTNLPYIMIKEEHVANPTNGYFRTQGFEVTINPNETEEYDFSWPYPIAPLVIKFNTNIEQAGDIINLFIAPNTTIGVITQSVTTGNTVLSVNSTVIDNIKVGFICTLTNGITTENLGEVINVNFNTSQITVSTPVTANFNPGSFIQMTINIIKDYILADTSPISHVIGDSKIGASYLPTNTIVRLRYKNNDTVNPVKFNWRVEYMY